MYETEKCTAMVEEQRRREDFPIVNMQYVQLFSYSLCGLRCFHLLITAIHVHRNTNAGAVCAK